MKTPIITQIIKGAVARCEMSAREVSRVTGIPYQTLQYRYNYPSTWRFCEWGAVLRHVEFTEEELNKIRKEVQK
jgi:hypothetical protein